MDDLDLSAATIDPVIGMNRSIQLLDVVALLHDRRDFGLVAGQVGTVVDVLAPGVFEVEFSDDEGCTYAMVALKESELIALHYNPVAA